MFWRQLAEGESRVCAAVIRRVTQFFPSFAPIRVRARIDGEIIELDRAEPIRLKKGQRHTIEAVVDRLVVREGVRIRLTDSIEIALKWGDNKIVMLRAHPNGCETWEELRYSTNYGSADSGFTLGELTPKHFSFNSHLGAVPAVHGLGTQLAFHPDLMISDYNN